MAARGRDETERTLRGVVLGCVLSLVCVQDLTASTVSATSGDAFDQAEHDKYCGCGPKCRKASCCCRGTAKDARPLSRHASSAATDPRDGTNPCLRGAPCHDPAAPVGPAVELIGKAAACGPRDGPLTLPETGRLLPSPPPGPAPAAPPSRLERPPRTAALSPHS